MQISSIVLVLQHGRRVHSIRMQTLLADVKLVSMRQGAINDSEFSKTVRFHNSHLLQHRLNVYITKPLFKSPKTDLHLISPYNIAAWLNIQVKRIEDMITTDKMP